MSSVSYILNCSSCVTGIRIPEEEERLRGALRQLQSNPAANPFITKARHIRSN